MHIRSFRFDLARDIPALFSLSKLETCVCVRMRMCARVCACVCVCARANVRVRGHVYV